MATGAGVRLLMNLLWSILTRQLLRRPRPRFRFSLALAEQGRYRVDLLSYTPMQPAGDPALYDRLPVKKAQRACRAMLAAATDNRAAFDRFLQTKNLVAGPRPEDWAAIEAWLRQSGEASVEPRHHDAQSLGHLRPRLEALVTELAIALAYVLAQRLPGSKVVCEADLPSWAGRRASPYPVVVDGAGQVVALPQGVLGTIVGSGLGGSGMMAQVFANVDTWLTRRVPDLVAEIEDWIVKFEADEGRLPNQAELADFAVESKIFAEQIPQALVDRLPR